MLYWKVLSKQVENIPKTEQITGSQKQANIFISSTIV